MAGNPLSRFIGSNAAAVMLSRLTGLARDLVFAAFFGTSFTADAFYLAFLLPNLLRRLFGEGALSSAFIPYYNEFGVQRSRQEQLNLGLNLLTILGLGLCVLSIIGSIAAPWIVRIVVPGWQPAQLAYTVKLTRLMFPYLFFVGLYSTFISILNAHDRYFWPGLSSAFLNAGMIGSLALAWLKGITDVALLGVWLSWGVLAGGFLQAIVNLPQLYRVGYRPTLRQRFHRETLSLVWNRFIPAAVTVTIWQVNWVTDRVMASFLYLGSISALSYGFRLVQLPIGVLAVSAGVVSTQQFSKHVAAGAWDKIARDLRYQIVLLGSLFLYATAVIFALGQDIIRLLFMRGAFDVHALELTYGALVCYSAGLIFYGFNRVLIPVFHAAKDTKTPMKIAIYSVIVNIVINLGLMFVLGHSGLALGTSVAVGFQCWLIWRTIRRTYPQLSVGNPAGALLKAGFVALGLGVGFYWLKQVFPGDSMLRVALRLIVLGGGGFILFSQILWWLGIRPDIRLWMKLWKRFRKS